MVRYRTVSSSRSRRGLIINTHANDSFLDCAHAPRLGRIASSSGSSAGLLTKPGRRFYRGRKYTCEWWCILAARGDARSLKFHLRTLPHRATFRVFTSSSPWHTQSSVQGINSTGSAPAKRWPSKSFPAKPATISHLLKLCFIVMVIK